MFTVDAPSEQGQEDEPPPHLTVPPEPDARRADGDLPTERGAAGRGALGHGG